MRILFYGETKDLEQGITFLQEGLSEKLLVLGDREEGAALLEEGDLLVEVKKSGEPGLFVSRKAAEARVIYSGKITFFRGLSHLLGAVREGETSFEKREKKYFALNGPMIDVSQGSAVLNLSTVKRLLRYMALMGLDLFMLYCEDSYDVPEEPYFGYMRGRYSQEDMREIDDYADAFGIEVIPCIQTLAHMVNTLRWKGIYGDITDDAETLLVGEERTYEFIRHLIRAASKPVRSRRIHIGMDEAWKLGLGNYLRKHGYTEKTAIMKAHLARVMEIVREEGLSPMMWSDMFLRAVTPRGEYYVDEAFEIPSSAKEAVPEDVELIYWDYYHDEAAFYEQMLRHHEALSGKKDRVIFAGGAWTWHGFAPDYPITFRHSEPALRTCKKFGVREVMMTVWGDCATECNVYAILPALQFFAEHGYEEAPAMEEIARRFNVCTGDRWDHFMAFSEISYIPGTDRKTKEIYATAKALLWQDLLTGLFDANIEGLPLRKFFGDLKAVYRSFAEEGGSFEELKWIYYHLADVLEHKSELGLSLRKAYLERDREGLEKACLELHELKVRVENLKNAHRKLWDKTYLRFGFDNMDHRYGGLLSRIDTALYRVCEYLSGQEDALEELEEKRLLYDGIAGMPTGINIYENIATPNETRI